MAYALSREFHLVGIYLSHILNFLLFSVYIYILGITSLKMVENIKFAKTNLTNFILLIEYKN